MKELAIAVVLLCVAGCGPTSVQMRAAEQAEQAKQAERDRVAIAPAVAAAEAADTERATREDALFKKLADSCEKKDRELHPDPYESSMSILRCSYKADQEKTKLHASGGPWQIEKVLKAPEAASFLNVRWSRCINMTEQSTHDPLCRGFSVPSLPTPEDTQQQAIEDLRRRVERAEDAARDAEGAASDAEGMAGWMMMGHH
jgi:hypothetical protein